MSRLTKADKEAILNEILQSKSARWKRDIELMARDLAERHVINSIPKATREKMRELPENYFSSVKEARLYDGKGILFRLEWDRDNMIEYVPKYMVKWDNCIQDQALPKMMEDLRTYARQVGKLEDWEASVKSEIRKILRPITTVKKLIEVWPEAPELAPKMILNLQRASAGNLQVIPNVREANKLLGVAK